MSKRLSVTVNGVAYPVKFGYGATCLLGEKWGLPGFTDVFMKAISIYGFSEEDAKDQDLDKIDEERLAQTVTRFENIEIMGDVCEAGIRYAAHPEDPDLVRNDLMDALTIDFALTGEIFGAFMATMPRPKEDEKKPVNAKTAGKQKALAKSRK